MIAIFSLLADAPAHAYLGPGLGMGAVGVALGVVGSILLGIFSIIWYPVKRLWRRMRGSRKTDGKR
jgi:Na+-driven multidrug efflux pump